MFDQAGMSEQFFHPHPSKSYAASYFFSLLVVFSAVEEVVLNILNDPIAAIAVGVVFVMKSVMILAQVAVSSAEARKVCNIRPFGEGSVYFVALFDLSLGGDPAQLSGVM